jgi:hypothetical protein
LAFLRKADAIWDRHFEGWRKKSWSKSFSPESGYKPT